MDKKKKRVQGTKFPGGVWGRAPSSPLLCMTPFYYGNDKRGLIGNMENIDAYELGKRLKILYICGARPDRAALEHLDGLIAAGVTAAQLRRKGTGGGELYEDTRVMADFCRARNVLFFVNDRLDVAIAGGADGVHLGASDLPVEAARGIAPKGFLIGATARDAETAARAQRGGADYIGSGAAFSSKTKQDTTLIGPSGIALVTASVRIPVVGIGGIGADNLRELAGCGIAGVAVGNALAGPEGTRAAERIDEQIRKGVLQ